MALITTTYKFEDGSIYAFYSFYANEAQALRVLSVAAKDMGISKVVWNQELPISRVIAAGKNAQPLFVKYVYQKGRYE